MKRLFAVPMVFVMLSACSPPETADIILTDGQVYTLDEAQPWAEAVAIRGERILAVGSNSEVRRHAGSNTRTITTDGAFILPGFNDAHVHVDGTGALLVGVNLLDVHEPAAFAQRVPVDSRLTGALSTA
jgi:predicted amidohydrolase YtcJ